MTVVSALGLDNQQFAPKALGDPYTGRTLPC